MASIQRFGLHGWRIYWKLYFQNGTNKEKYKASNSKDRLEQIFPDITRIETLSRQNDLLPRDLMVAYNCKFISKEEASTLKLGAARRKSECKRGEIFKHLNDQLSSIMDNIAKIKEKLKEYLEPEEYLRENDVALGQHMKDEWSQWKKRFIPSEYPDPPPGIIRPTTTGIGVPKTSGIYFAWEDGNIVYVGQSLNMSNRARLGHGAISGTDLLSFVPIGKDDLSWAESYYIGILRPQRNFKGYAKNSTAYPGGTEIRNHEK
jgi:hypothetical protein